MSGADHAQLEPRAVQGIDSTYFSNAGLEILITLAIILMTDLREVLTSAWEENNTRKREQVVQNSE